MVTETKDIKQKEYNLIDLKIKSKEREIDIRRSFIQLNVFEDIFSNAMTGNIVMEDGLNLVETLPIIGGEELTLKYKTGEGDDVFNKTFIIYKIENTELVKEKVKVYKIHFTSAIVLDNFNTRLSRYFEGYTSDIVKKILTTNLNIDESTITTERTKSYKQFVVPNWSALKTINYLAANSVSDFYDSGAYVLYEHRKGFSFVSLDFLADSDETQHIVYTFNTNANEYTLNKAENWQIIESFDIIENTRRGMYGSSMLTHDILKKSHQTTTMTYDKAFSQFTHLHEGGKPLTSETEFNTNNRLFFSSENYSNFDVMYRLKERVLRMREFENYKFLITLAGNSNQQVGNKIRFDVPSTKNAEITTLDSFLAGYFLISKIKHTFTRESHEMVVELRKDIFKGSNK